MRSRLPGKLRSDSLLLGGVIVKNWTRFAKRRLIMRAVIGQIFHKTDQSPREQEAEAQQQQQSDRDIHGVHRNKSQGTILKCEALEGCRTTLINNVSAKMGLGSLTKAA
jgi:hypothetical protein